MDMNYEKIMEFLNTNDKFTMNNNITITKISEGKSEAAAKINDDSCNFMGYPHGGILYSMLDVLAGTSVLSFGYVCVTVNINANFINKTKDKILYGYGEAVKKGHNIFVCRCTIEDENKNVICTGLATMHPLKFKIEDYIK